MLGMWTQKPLRKHTTGRPRWRCIDKILCGAGRWMELAQEHVQWQVLVLVVLNIWVSYRYLNKNNCICALYLIFSQNFTDIN